MIEESTDAAEETHYVRVRQHVPALVAHRLDELHEPDGGVDGDALPAYRLDGHAAAGRLQQAPEIFDSHGSGRARSLASEYLQRADARAARARDL